MAVEANTPITAIEGIGPKFADMLAEIGAYRVFDLLRASTERLHRAVADRASFEQVSQWRTMASFLQLAEVTPQWAEGLFRGGIDSVDELHISSVTKIQTALASSRDQGIIPDVPTLEQIAEMSKDAGIVRYTGTYTTTIRDVNGEPVEGATVSIGDIQGVTDPAGRTRLLRIPLGSAPAPLRVECDGFRTLVLHKPQLASDHQVTVVRVHQLEKSSPDDPEEKKLSALEGDELPPIIADTLRETTHGESDLRVNDLLSVMGFYDSSSDVRLSSLLMEYESGRFLVHKYRVPVDRFAVRPSIGDGFIYDGSDFVPFELTPDAVRRYRIRLQLKKHFAGRPDPTTPEERSARLAEKLAFLEERGANRLKYRNQK